MKYNFVSMVSVGDLKPPTPDPMLTRCWQWFTMHMYIDKWDQQFTSFNTSVNVSVDRSTVSSN